MWRAKLLVQMANTCLHAIAGSACIEHLMFDGKIPSHGRIVQGVGPQGSVRGHPDAESGFYDEGEHPKALCWLLAGP